jgi:hypothetical protein
MSTAAAGSTPTPLINPETTRAHELEARVDDAQTQGEVLAALRAGWADPPATYRPHTRWWWPGNAVTREGISWQLEQMKDQGLGGVEIMSAPEVYTKGNIEFGSPEFFSLVQFTVEKARALGMEVALNLGPGWNEGNQWVAPADRSKLLAISEQDSPGGEVQNLALNLPTQPDFIHGQMMKFEAAVAVPLRADGTPDATHRIDLTAQVAGDRSFSIQPALHLTAHLPQGRWRIMGFWTTFSGQTCIFASKATATPYVVDYLDPAALRRFLDNIGSRYAAVVGSSFGQTVDSYFGDSPELKEGFSLWTTGLFDRFQKEKGYDLRPYLPALVDGGAPETPYLRQDFGSFLSEVGMEGLIDSEASYCAQQGLQMRQQPHYRYPAELIEAAGHLQRPETEFSRRSFDPVAYPHKLTVSGAQFYPSKEKRWVSAEAFTFVNDKYRTTMEQIKQATDAFLRDGIGQFYNHGYFYTPEKELAPSRDLIWMNRISPVNTWWPYYHGLANYQARATFLARQGRAAADVLVYSPMPTVWSEQASFQDHDRVRNVPFGPLPKLLVASGYDFDCVNDDLLQHSATIRDGQLTINGYSYSVLILPRVLTLAPETLAVIERFVRAGGTVFALETLPARSDTLINHQQRDQAVADALGRLFNSQGGARAVGAGWTYFLPGCDGFVPPVFNPRSVDWTPTAAPTPAYAEFIRDLKSRLTPAFEIAGTPLSSGLTFRHSQIGPVDAWFICNLQPTAQAGQITLKTRGRFAQAWDPMTGAIHSLPDAHRTADGRLALEIDLQPWESMEVLTTAAPDSSLAPAPKLAQAASLPVEGTWQLQFSGLGGAQKQLTLDHLADWRTLAGLRDFSGGATYSIDFDVPTAITHGTAWLDLGEVHEVADVQVNGREAGTAWMEPYRVNVTGCLKPGRNRLDIHVVNLLWNYAAGLKQPTPIPAELQEHYGSADDPNYSGWKSLQDIKTKYQDDRLPSGLLGPVRLISYQPSAAH